MSEIAIISNVDPVQIPLDEEFTILIKPAYKGKFVVCIVDKTGKYIALPDCFAVYEIYSQQYLDTNEDNKFYTGSLFNVYEFYYKNEKVLDNIECYTMEEYCGFPYTSNKYYPNFYTALVKGTMIKNTNVIQVSSTMDLDVGIALFGTGIPEFTTITHVNDESNTIEINHVVLESCSNVTLTAR
jgi:hypothetical protein